MQSRFYDFPHVKRSIELGSAPANENSLDVDYNAFRLFQLAVLFRSAISTHEAFEHVVFAEAELDRYGRYQSQLAGVAA